MKTACRPIALAARIALALGLFLPIASLPAAAESLVSRGEYLATIMDCTGCHTEGALVGRPDPTRLLAGSSLGFGIPDYGYVYPPNLTPDLETGLGAWSEAEIVAAIRNGVRPDGRELAVMPWRSYGRLDDADAAALVAYLKSLPPMKFAAPPLTGWSETPPAPYMTVVVP
jgi:mono/diheme cytochrome c family protein